MAVNLVVQDGVVKSMALKYDAQSKPELRFTLQQVDHATDGKAWISYWPCCASGAAAERLASEIEEGQHIVLSAARLCHRKREGKMGLQSRMEILVWTVERLTTGPQDEATAYQEQGAGEIVQLEGAGEVRQANHGLEPTGAAALPKKGKPRYPKWKPAPVDTN